MKKYSIDSIHGHFLSSIFPHAKFESPVLLGDNIRIWGTVMRDAEINDGCTIGQGAHIGRSVVVGKSCKIQNGAQLFEGVVLEDDVFVGPCAVFTNVTNPRAHVSRKDRFERTLVKRGASIGANATILCGVTIGEYALVGAGSVVTKNVAPHAIVVGNPAKWYGWACRCGETLPLDHTILLCTACESRYRMQDDEITLVDEEQPNGQSGAAP